jgi:hypothetical protein
MKGFITYKATINQVPSMTYWLIDCWNGSDDNQAKANNWIVRNV